MFCSQIQRSAVFSGEIICKIDFSIDIYTSSSCQKRRYRSAISATDIAVERCLAGNIKTLPGKIDGSATVVSIGSLIVSKRSAFDREFLSGESDGSAAAFRLIGFDRNGTDQSCQSGSVEVTRTSQVALSSIV